MIKDKHINKKVHKSLENHKDSNGHIDLNNSIDDMHGMLSYNSYLEITRSQKSI